MFLSRLFVQQTQDNNTASKARILMLACVMIATASMPALGQSPKRMRFRNNLQPGAFTVHKITRVITRRAPRKHYVEDLSYEQVAKWVQCNIDEPAPGRVMFYQMMADKPAKLVGLFRDKRKISPLPPASDFGMSPGSTRLHSTYKTPRDAPVQVPLVNPAEKIVMAMLLDYAHWPSKRIEVGHRWQQDLSLPGFRGTQTFEFVDVTEADGKVVARLTLFVEGDFTDDLAKDYTFSKAQAILYWSRPDRTLLKMESRAEYARQRDNGPELYELKMNVGLIRETTLNEETQELVKKQLTLFSEALKSQRAGQNSRALTLCSQYRSQWPKSIWLPAVRELEDRIQVLQEQAAQPITMKRLAAGLAQTARAYQAAIDNYEYDLVDQTTEAFGKICERHHAGVVRLARSTDATQRAHAILALAFSGVDDDLGILEKGAKDTSPDVREAALAALAACRSPRTNITLLIESLGDDNAAVRRQACNAVRGCISPEHFSVVAAVERLHFMIADDRDEQVRLEAIHAIAAIGVPADIERLQEVQSRETNKAILDAIEHAITRLRNKNA